MRASASEIPLNSMLLDIYRVRVNAFRGNYRAANERFVFPAEDKWEVGIHTPPHGFDRVAKPV